MKYVFYAFIGCLLGFQGSYAQAQPTGKDLISLSLGYYNAFESEDHAADFRLEYRPDYDVLFGIKPWGGIEMTSDASIWAGGGFLYDFEFTPNWYVTPSIGAGFYAKGSSDLDLGHPIEFRSQLELSYEFENASRMGLAVSHLSNASLDEDNPGTEVLSFYWHIPVERFTAW